MKRKQGKRPVRGAPRRLSLANWPVSVRLAALFVIASLMGLVFGGLRVAGAIGDASAYGRTTQLAILSEQVTALAQALEDERDLTAGVSALAPLSRATTPEQASLTAARRTTDGAAGLTVARASGIGPAFPSSVQAAAASVIAQARNLTGLRAMVTGQRPSAVIGDYSGALADLFALNDQLTSMSGDAKLTSEARALGAMSRAKDQASQQRAIVDVALIESGLSDAVSGPRRTAGHSAIGGAAALRAAGGIQALIIARSLQLTDVLSFQSAATAAQESAYLAVTASPQVAAALKISTLVTATGDPQAIERSSPGVTPATAPGLWYRDMSAMIGGMRTIESAAAGALVARSELRQHQAVESALLTAVVTIVAVLLTLLATALVGRSLLHPLRRLQADALEIATVRLPARVTAAAMGTDLGQESGGEVEPIGVRSTDEIGKVARAFDQVHAEAVRLASTEAQLRGNLNSMFISLSRRSVPLIERLAAMIDSLEQNEDDPDQLANLFAMDHMVTRMRRNSENLLVLGGEEPVRKWSGPVPLSDVIHAAAAEIEQYNRVMLTVQPGAVVSGQAAADIVHLLAELIENATLFSPRDTAVRVSAREMGRGGVAIEVRDEGIGVSASRLADMNWRLDHPPVIDVSVSRHMGLFAVSRLAARHGIRVRLRAGTQQGLSALIWLPPSVTRLEPSPAGVHSRRPADAPAPGEPLAPSRNSTGRHRLGLLGRTGDQPALAFQPALAGEAGEAGEAARADQAAVADSLTVADMPAVTDRPTRATTAWFAAKAPSGRSSPQQDPDLPGTSPPAGYGDWGALAEHGQAGPKAPDAQAPAARPKTSAGLPRRVPRDARDARDAAPVLSAPVLSSSQERPTPGPETGPQAAFSQAAFSQAGAPRRRSPEAARSRLAGFQLGSREAREDTGAAGDREAREAEHEPD